MKLIRNFENTLTERLREKAPLIQAVVGPRQVGKTTGVTSIVDSWDGGKLMVSADTLQPLSTEWLALHFQRARDLGKGALFVIDEIQKVPNWSEALKKLYDESKKLALKIVILGSASFRLQRGLVDSLAGRYEIIPAPHWSFFEMKKCFDFTFEDFLAFGGYPGATPFINDYQRWRDYLLNSIIENVLSKDLSNLTDIRNPTLLRQLFFVAMGYPAQEISFQKLIGQLQDKGAVATVKHYLEILESAHLLKLVYKYGGGALSTRTSSPKILPLDPSLISATTNTRPEQINAAWRGRVFEDAVGTALRQIADELYYWRDRNLEVDYVLKIGKEIIAIEVKSGRPGKLSGLNAFKAKYPKAHLGIINWKQGRDILSQQSLEDLKTDPLKIVSL